MINWWCWFAGWLPTHLCAIGRHCSVLHYLLRTARCNKNLTYIQPALYSCHIVRIAIAAWFVYVIKCCGGGLICKSIGWFVNIYSYIYCVSSVLFFDMFIVRVLEDWPGSYVWSFGPAQALIKARGQSPFSDEYTLVLPERIYCIGNLFQPSCKLFCSDGPCGIKYCEYFKVI